MDVFISHPFWNDNFLNTSAHLFFERVGIFAVQRSPSPNKMIIHSLNTSLEETWKSLEKKLPKNTQIHTVLSPSSSMVSAANQQKIFAKSVLHIPELKLSPEGILVLEHIQKLEKVFLEDFQLQHPYLPWNKTRSWKAHAQCLLNFDGVGEIYNTSHDALSYTWKELNRKKKILLHVCCGPDAAGVINQLKRDFDVLCFWYDPNIQPAEEHDKRLEAFKQVAEIEDVPYIVGEYDVDNFLERIKGLEHTPEQGAKCSNCYDMRLERSVVEAKNQNCDLYATTLAISPHKVQQKLIAFGQLNEKRYGIPYYHKNFMRDEGFKKSVEYTREYNIYRQDYCGCIFSLHEGGPEARKKARELGVG